MSLSFRLPHVSQHDQSTIPSCCILIVLPAVAQMSPIQSTGRYRMRIRRHADACDGSMSDAQALRAPVPPRKCSHRYSRIDSYSDVRTSRELWTGSTSHCMRISRSVIRKQFPVNRHCILTQDLALTCWTRVRRQSSQPFLAFCNSIWLSRPALQKEFAMGANGSSRFAAACR